MIRGNIRAAGFRVEDPSRLTWELTLTLMPSPLFRFRISTAFLALGLLGLPFAVHWVPTPRLFPPRSAGEYFFNTFLYDYPLQFFFLAFIAALITIIVLMARRKWRSIPQHLCELAIAFAGFTVAPLHGF